MKYLISVIGVSNFGEISFAQAFIGYFIIIIDYGFNITATRNIAQCKDNKKSISLIFSNTFYAKIFLLFLCSIVLIILIYSVPKFQNDMNIYMLFWGMILGSCLFPQWFFQGIQKMGYITVVNAIIKILLLLSVFLFVSKENDYIYVPLIYSISYIIPGLYALFLVNKYCNINFVINIRGIILSLKDGFYIFTSSAVSTVLNGSTIFIMGFIVSNTMVGYYSGYDKLIKACLLLFASITTAIYPHVSILINENRKKGIRYIKKAGLYTLLLAIFVALTINLFSDTIVTILFTESFLKYRLVLLILSIWLIFGVLNNFIGIQYLTCIGHSRIYALSLLTVGILTIPLIIGLTRQYSCYGTALSILIGEITLTIIMLGNIVIRKL